MWTPNTARLYKSAGAVMLALYFALAFSACSSFRALGDWANDNPAIMDLAVGQGVGRFIEGGDDAAAETARAERVVAVAGTMEAYIEGNPESTVGSLLDAVTAAIDWDAYSPADQELITGVINAIAASLTDAQDGGLLSETETVGLLSMIATTKRVAGRYIN